MDANKTRPEETTTPEPANYLWQIPMNFDECSDTLTFHRTVDRPGSARHQFESSVARIVSRAVREAVAEDRKARAAPTMTPPSPSELTPCPACDGTGWHHVSMARGCGARRCDRCGGSGVVAAREPEPTRVAHDEPEPEPPPEPTPRERLYRAFAGRATDADFDTAAQMLMASFKNADLATLEFVCGCLAGEQGGRK